MKKTRELILYIIFGVLTTAVNYVAFFLCNKVMAWQVANVIAWVLGVLFAFVTNRTLVFQSDKKGIAQVSLELVKFSGSRIFSLLFEYGFLFVGIALMANNTSVADFINRMITGIGISVTNEDIVKIVANVFVVIINYVFSKLLVFRKKK